MLDFTPGRQNVATGQLESSEAKCVLYGGRNSQLILRSESKPSKAKQDFSVGDGEHDTGEK